MEKNNFCVFHLFSKFHLFRSLRRFRKKKNQTAFAWILNPPAVHFQTFQTSMSCVKLNHGPRGSCNLLENRAHMVAGSPCANLPCDCSNGPLHGCTDHWVTRARFLQLLGERMGGQGLMISMEVKDHDQWKRRMKRRGGVCGGLSVRECTFRWMPHRFEFECVWNSGGGGSRWMCLRWFSGWKQDGGRTKRERERGGKRDRERESMEFSISLIAISGLQWAITGLELLKKLITGSHRLR